MGRNSSEFSNQFRHTSAPIKYLLVVISVTYASSESLISESLAGAFAEFVPVAADLALYCNLLGGISETTARHILTIMDDPCAIINIKRQYWYKSPEAICFFRSSGTDFLPDFCREYWAFTDDIHS